MKLHIFILLFFSFSLTVAAQQQVTVIVTEANLRGTPKTDGTVVTSVTQGEIFELIKKVGVWYLVQTPEYVGWIHGNTIRLTGAGVSTRSPARPPVSRTPRTTTKPVSGGASPFNSEYVGNDVAPTITIKNDSNLALSLNFGGVIYRIKAGQTESVAVEGGAYEFSVSAPGVRTLSGVKRFDRGYRYDWSFYIVTRRVR